MSSDERALGVLQLCSDRRYHRLTMAAFERATGLRADEYWIEARPGGAPAYADTTRLARIAYREGARHMGWAAHGDGCRGFYGASDDELRARLQRAGRARSDDFRDAAHYVLFALRGDVEVTRIR
ncbi:MAG: hypothetical protein M3321_03645 [Actinomycetota bacterium]|nr:hypothetical protein [Actinomycetota bacterium]